MANQFGVQEDVAEKFGQLESSLGRTLGVNSGYRSAAKNAEVGGASHSQHIHGKALDIDVRNMSIAERVGLIAEASRLGFTGIGAYTNAIHVDTGPRRGWGPNYHNTSIPGWAKDVMAEHMQNKFQGTAPAPVVAKVERQQLPAIGPVPTARPETTPQLASYQAPTPTARPSTEFDPGGINNPAKVDLSQLSPVSSAQASPAQAATPSSLAQNPAAISRSMPSVDPSRFGEVGPAINNAPQLKAALQAQAASIAAPSAPPGIGPISTPTAAKLAATAQPTAQPAVATERFSPTPASYQTPAFSTAAPKIDAFKQAPMPGIQPAASNPYSQLTSLTPEAPQEAPQTQTPQLAALPAARTISTPRVAEVAPATIQASPAPAANPSLNQFPDKPAAPGLLSNMFSKASTPGLLSSLAGTAIGTAVAGPVGGLLGGLLGKGLGNQYGGGLLSGYNGPTQNIGSGLAAMSSVIGGGAPVGATAYSRSMPGMSVTSLPGGAIQRTNQYGMTQITTADGRTGRATKGKPGGANGNYGGIKSEGARNAISNGVGGLF